MTRRGNRRVELLDAVDAQQVRDTLRGRGCWVSSVKPHTRSRYKHSTLRVPTKQLLMSLEALKLLVSSGAKIDRALRVAVEQAPAGRLRYVLASIAEGTVGGNFAASFEQFPNVFPEPVIEILKANQASGDIEMGLKHVCEYYQEWEGIRANVKRGAFMPIIGLITFLAAFTVIFGVTMPMFKKTFIEIIPYPSLPGLTKVFFKVSDVFTGHLTFILVSLFVVGWGGRMLLRIRQVRALITRVARRLPIIGPAMRSTALARLCITYKNLSANGLKTLGILEICSRVVGDESVRAALLRVRQALLDNKAEQIGDAFVKENKVFPPEFLTAVSIAQSNLPEIFGKLADYYSSESKKRIDFAIATLEPLMTLIIGAFALSAGAALILPITQLINKMGQ